MLHRVLCVLWRHGRMELRHILVQRLFLVHGIILHVLMKFSFEFFEFTYLVLSEHVSILCVMCKGNDVTN